MTSSPQRFAFALAAVLAASAAAAQTPDVRRHYSLDGQRLVAETVVPTGDLDLDSDAGVRTLRQRIEAAADAVCGREDRAADNYRRQAYLVCRDAAVGSAIARLPPSGRARLAAAGSAATGW